MNRTTYICVSIHKNSYLYLCLSFALCVIQFVWLVSVLYLQRCCCCCFSLFLLFSMFYLHTPFFSLVFFKMCTNGCVENVRKYSMDIICDGKCRRRRRQKKKNVVGLIYRLCCSWHVSHYIISGQQNAFKRPNSHPIRYAARFLEHSFVVMYIFCIYCRSNREIE